MNVVIYIGETKRNLKTTVKEHMNNYCKVQVEKSSVAKALPRPVRESIEVLKHITMTQECYPLSEVWTSVFHKS